MEKIVASMRGIYRDILKDQNNTVIFDSGWVSNVIVNRCRILLAAFMKNDPNKQARGIQRLKIGQGEESWDNDGTPVPDASLTGLLDPAPFSIEAADLEVVYLDNNNLEGHIPNPRLQITATLGTDQPPPPSPGLSFYSLREFGLFGEYIDGGEVYEYMIDCIRHPVIRKNVAATLIRVVRLYF